MSEDLPSKGAVRRASRVLRERHLQPTEEVIEAFRVAHAWREAHLAPTRAFRSSIAAHTRSIAPEGFTAARLKRMRSIRRKLRQPGHNLVDVQDLGGCRAVLPDIASCTTLATRILERSIHTPRRRTDYIDRPRDSGYRSDHIVFRIEAPNDPIAHGRLVEVQLRTALQHAWATAVEAVGLVRRENLKGGEGHQGWLRFFQLMAGEIAHIEQACPPPSVPENVAERRGEIADLNAQLDAVASLDSYRRAIRAASDFEAMRGGLFLIQYDPNSREVSVDRTALSPGERYARAEQSAQHIDTVLVDVDGAEDLHRAFPNYYLDVRMFLELIPSSTRTNADQLGIAPSQDTWRPDFSQILGRKWKRGED